MHDAQCMMHDVAQAVRRLCVFLSSISSDLSISESTRLIANVQAAAKLISLLMVTGFPRSSLHLTGSTLLLSRF
jgi:hypothetical protein